MRQAPLTIAMVLSLGVLGSCGGGETAQITTDGASGNTQAVSDRAVPIPAVRNRAEPSVRSELLADEDAGKSGSRP